MRNLERKIRWGLILIMLISLPVAVYSQDVDHYESIILTGSDCKYYIPAADIGSNWISRDFDDSGWNSGILGIGYADGDDNTEISSGIPSLYIRCTFNVPDTQRIIELLLDADYDDGFIAYLNGTEVARANVANPVSWNMELATDHEAKMYSGGLPERFSIDNTIVNENLIQGENMLAIEVHNRNTTSSDLSSNFFLHAGISDAGTYYLDLPAWFWAPPQYDTFMIPLMIIETDGLVIPDEPRIQARMGLIDNGPGNANHLEDPWNDYNGYISIERRGESSSGFEKKSYSIELQNADGTNNNVSILGLPVENDFVLHGPYSDKTMMKNALVFGLYNDMGNWAPRTRYIELFLNGDYRGIYVLMEKLKRDEERVDIDKLTPADTSDIDISGGYILRRDKKGKLEPYEYWTSPVDQIYYEQLWYEYYDPDYYELIPEQRAYIRDYMKRFDEMMSGPNFNDPVSGYRSFIDVRSFTDMLIINEISKGIDSYMFSTYFYKQNDEDGGKFFAGPPWDYNLAFGNINYGENQNVPYVHSWLYDNWSRVYWFKRLLEDAWFENEVFCRWDRLRGDILSNEKIEFFIDSSASYLGEAIDRNFEKYQTLGTYIWPAIAWPDTYEEEILMLKTWTFARLDWMDGEWSNRCVPTSVEEISKDIARDTDLAVRIRPNPSDLSNTYIDITTNRSVSSFSIEILDLQGRLVGHLEDYMPAYGYNAYRLPDLSYLSRGVYLVRIMEGNRLLHVEKLIKQN